MSIDLEAIKARAAAATPGPWFAEPIGDRDESALQRGRTIQGVIRWQGYLNSLDCGEDDATAEFIAHARTDVPALVAEVERLRAENERLRTGGTSGSRLDHLLTEDQLRSLESDLAGMAGSRRRAEVSAADWPMA